MSALAYGCNQALPEGVRLAWGARLIAPDDLLHDRQSWTDDKPPLGEVGPSDRSELAAWLNGGALRGALIASRNEFQTGSPRWDGSSDDVRVLYEDERGVIKGSPQGSHGYVYVCAYLHKDVPGADAS